MHSSGKTFAEVMADSTKDGDDPATVAKVIVAAATDAKPRLRYPAGVTAGRVSALRRFVPARSVRQADPQDQPVRRMTPAPETTPTRRGTVMEQRREPDAEEARRGAALWAVIITSVAGFMAALDNLVVTTALPSIRQDLGGGLEDLEWTVSAYTLTFAVLVMFGAVLGDRFGRRLMFVVGLGIFTAASAAAALAPGMGEVIAARAAQGVGAAILTPLTLTLLVGAVPPARRGAALGVWGAASGVAVAMGPLIGGTLTESCPGSGSSGSTSRSVWC